MSHLTDHAREALRAAEPAIDLPGQSLESILASNPARRTILKGFGLVSAFGLTGFMAGCDDDTDAPPVATPTPTPTPTPAPVSYAVTFAAIAANMDDKVTVPAGYVAEVLFSAGEAVVPGATAWSQGSYLTSAQAEQVAGGNHDGMHYFPVPGADANISALLVMNHELPDYNILFPSKTYNAATASPEEKKIALSAVGVSVIEILKGADGKWSVVKTSKYNKRYTGNTVYRVGGPASGIIGSSVAGTLNNCSSGATPWGTYLTCEETTSDYIDTTRPARNFGWVIEIDPQGELAEPTKRTSMGRFGHENVAYLADSANRVAFYMGDDSTPGCIYKFIPSRAFSPSNRAANSDLLDYGTLYVARFNANGSGDWIELTQGKNGLVPGATDAGNVSQGPQTPVIVNFASQADVLVNTASAARVAGGTIMDRPEWITVAPDKSILCTLTNNSGRRVVDAANPRVTNLHGHIIKWKEAGDSPLATSFTWEIFLQAGDPSLLSGGANLVGNINGDTFSSPDGLRVDPQGRLWVQTDHSIPGTSGVTGKTIEQVFGQNAMFYVDQTTKRSMRFLVGPNGQEITGIAYSPDLTAFFINIQHPTGNWPEAGKEPRSATIVVRRTDGKPVGA